MAGHPTIRSLYLSETCVRAPADDLTCDELGAAVAALVTARPPGALRCLRVDFEACPERVEPDGPAEADGDAVVAALVAALANGCGALTHLANGVFVLRQPPDATAAEVFHPMSRQMAARLRDVVAAYPTLVAFSVTVYGPPPT